MIKRSNIIFFYIIFQIILSQDMNTKKKIKKSIPRQRLSMIRQSVTFNIDSDEILSATFVSNIAGAFNNKLLHKNSFEKKDDLLSLLDSLKQCFISSGIRATIKNTNYLQKGKYKRYFKIILFDLFVKEIVCLLFYILRKWKYRRYLRVILFLFFTLICSNDKPQFLAMLYIIKQILKFFGYVIINIITKKVIKDNNDLQSTFYGVVSSFYDIIIGRIINSFKIEIL